MTSLFYRNPYIAATHFITMKLIPLSLALCALVCAAHAQELKRITRRSGDINTEKEVFYVLKSNHSIRQGEYQKYRNDKLITSGFYNNDKPDSTWTEYLFARPVAVKHFSQGYPTGVWEFYTTSGKPEINYSYINGEVTDFRNKENTDSAKSKGLTIDATGKIISAMLDRAPIRLMASGEYMRFIMYNVRYPPEAIRNQQQGTVTIAIHIDETGRVFDYSVYRPVSPSLDNEALRIQQMITCSYLPAIQDGRKVKSVLLQPVTFRTTVSSSYRAY